jgi:hypothetical protein
VRPIFGIFVTILLVALVALSARTITRTTFLDARTGRKRQVVRIAFLVMSDRVYETQYSKLWNSYFGPYPSPEWLPESQFRGFRGGRSPSYGFLDAFRWEDRIISAFNYAQFQPDLARSIVSSFVVHLERKDPHAARLYSLGLLSFAMDHEGELIAGTNSPAWLKQGVFTGYESDRNQ